MIPNIAVGKLSIRELFVHSLVWNRRLSAAFNMSDTYVERKKKNVKTSQGTPSPLFPPTRSFQIALVSGRKREEGDEKKASK